MPKADNVSLISKTGTTESIKNLLADIQAVDPDEIRARLTALAAEEKELRRVLRLRLSSAKAERLQSKRK